MGDAGETLRLNGDHPGPAVAPAAAAAVSAALSGLSVSAPSAGMPASTASSSSSLGRIGSFMPGMEKERRIHLHFRISHMTTWGQSLALCGSGALLGNWSFEKGHTMLCHHEKDDLVWEVLVALPWASSYSYKYGVVHFNEDGSVAVEKLETITRTVALHEHLQHGDTVEIMDTWMDRSNPSSIFATCAFTKVIHPHRLPRSAAPASSLAPAVGEAVVRFKVTDWLLEEGETVCVTGALPQLGSWQQDQMLRLTESDSFCWEGEVRVPYGAFAFSYKYAVHTANGTTMLETGEPRVAALPVAGSNAAVGAPAIIIRQDGYLRRNKLWRGAGVALPVFSLRTKLSVGAGEFLDLLPLVDLAATMGLRMVQVLPVNDTSVYGNWWDSYPYSSISVHALHPQYLALRALREQLPADIQEQISAARQQLDGPVVDYEGVMAAKGRIARAVFDRYGAETLDSDAFKAWFADNEGWVRPYAAFCFLRDLFGTAEHWEWGALATPTPALIQRLTSPEQEYYATVSFTYYVQYHLHRQLLAASAAATAKRVVLKGDIPIGVDKRSVDTWMQPSLFRMNKSTGAPPDYFDPMGQNWGFPTYNWEVMAKDGYAWWRERLSHMAQYFQAYRIDHILGFFRIWEIPGDCSTGLLGHFRPSLPLWRSELEGRGLWDLERLVQPYVRRHLLEEQFGAAMASEIAARYFVEKDGGVYEFRPQYATEKAITSIPERPDSPEWLVEEMALTKKGLLNLRQNVVLLQDPEDPLRFYPRIGLMGSSSYKELDGSWREALAQLHDDYYFRRQEEEWRHHALRTLPVLMDATDMLVFGEDLGFVPGCLPPVMTELGLVGLRIQRMPTESGVEFNECDKYPYLTVASPSCHDVAPLRAWWEEDAERRERFWFTTLGGAGPPPAECIPEVARTVVQQHLSSPSVWCILPIQDIMALMPSYCERPAREEIINDPTKSKHYWRYRIQVSLEDLAQDSSLIALMQDMLLAGERCNHADLAAAGKAAVKSKQ